MFDTGKTGCFSYTKCSPFLTLIMRFTESTVRVAFVVTMVAAAAAVATTTAMKLVYLCVLFRFVISLFDFEQCSL